MPRRLLSIFAGLIALAAFDACAGGNAGPFYPSSTPAATTQVNFLVVVPALQTSARKPSVTAPAGAQSVTIALQSVGGAASTASPTSTNLSASTSGCQSTAGGLSCVITQSAPVGTLIYSIEFFGGTSGTGTPLGGGNLSVTTQAGQTADAPATLGGTVAKIALSVGTAELGNSVTLPVTIQAEDANGYTIIGTYTNPLTLTDNDASSQTSLSTTSVASSTAAAAVTLSYLGGAMPQPATISASTSGVSSSNVTPASFSPNGTAPVASGATITYTTTGTYEIGTNGTPAPPAVAVTASPFTATIVTGATFNGNTNVIAVDGDEYAPTSLDFALGAFMGIQATPSPSQVVYEQWNTSGSNAVLQYLGASDPVSGTQIACSAPYQQLLVLPLPATWDALSGTGPCTYNSLESFSGEAADFSGTFNADGSYNSNVSVEESGSQASEGVDVASNGAQTIALNIPGTGIAAASIPAITSGAATVSVTVSAPGAAPAATTAPNPWLVTGATASGAQPTTLASDTFATVGSISSLPAQCAVPSSALGASPTISQANETVVVADPGSFFRPLYATDTIKHYYVQGIGEVCNESLYAATILEGGSPEWFADDYQVYAMYESDIFTYVSAVTGLSADAVHARRTLAAGASVLSASTEAGVIARMYQPHSSEFGAAWKHSIFPSTPLVRPARP